ncbi:hypothetical protein SteCoe_15825 [Stentor coeruleus]|uniref:SMP-30/Gluconolactonase/LRE-like region domain-containing protein n=1 Tax=Stentor coeruleus TaxID=5963 RepID=A0A1R2C2U7_9CILI|nr:hypothetical protein SteCoe_15825 [Stentor coeruleus]
MEEVAVGQFEELTKGQIEGLSSVSEDFDGNLFFATSEGFIYALNHSGFEKCAETGGQPFCILHDTSNTLFIADLAQQAIYSYSDEDSVQELIKSYEGRPYLGPNSMAFHESSNSLYFTDSGPLGETSLASPRGSVYVADVESGNIKPVILDSLAHPAGIAMNSDGKCIYVAETYRNRIIKICTSSNGSYHSSVFYQFSGRLGPTAMCISDSNLLYVAQYEFSSLSPKGKISVINSSGVLVKFFSTPISEITSMSFSRMKNNILYITGAGKCYKVAIPGP